MKCLIMLAISVRTSHYSPYCNIYEQFIDGDMSYTKLQNTSLSTIATTIACYCIKNIVHAVHMGTLKLDSQIQYRSHKYIT